MVRTIAVLSSVVIFSALVAPTAAAQSRVKLNSLRAKTVDPAPAKPAPQGQPMPPGSQLQVAPPAATLASCTDLISTKPSRDNEKAIHSSSQILLDCLTRLQKEIEDKKSSESEAAHADLLENYLGFWRLARWTSVYSSDAGADSDQVKAEPTEILHLKRAVDDLNGLLNLTLVNHGLKEANAVTAEVRGGEGGAWAGRLPSESTEQGERAERQESQQMMHIAFETQHWGKTGSNMDVAIDGQIGIEPRIALAKVGDDATATKLTAITDSAMSFETGLRLSWQASTNSTFSIGGHLGGFAQAASSSIVKVGGKDTTAIDISNTSGAGEVYWTGQARFQLFDSPVPLVRLSKATLSPTFEIWAIFVHDNRFSAEKGRSLQLTTDPRRYRIGAQLSLNKISGISVDESRPLAIVISFEREGSFGNSQVPDVTRVVVRANIDLLKTLTGQNKTR